MGLTGGRDHRPVSRARAKAFPALGIRGPVQDPPRLEGSTRPREAQMRIHHVTPYFHPEIGGLEESVKRFAAWQAERGNQVVVHTLAFTSTWDPLLASDQIDGVTIRRYPPVVRRGYYRTWFRPDLDETDLIHLHGYAVRTNDRVARNASGKPLVYSLHHGVRMPHPTRTHRLLRRGYDYLVGLRTLRLVDRILVASQGDVPWLTRRRIPAEKVRVVPTPLSESDYIPCDPKLGRQVAGADRFVLYVGRLHREKGVAHLLDAFARLPANAHLVFAGPDGGMLANLRQRTEALHLSERVRFLGPVAEDEKRALLAASTCLALPSFHEAQGLTILEAWAQARPVVATRVGALAELVVDHENGLLVPFGDVGGLAKALSRLWNDEDAGRRMGGQGRLLAERYRLDRVAPELQTIYEEITLRSR